MGDIWSFFEEMRRRAVAACPDHRVVLLPQSIQFNDDAAWPVPPWPVVRDGSGTKRLLRQDEEGSGQRAEPGQDWADLMPPGVGPRLLAHRPGLRMVQRAGVGAVGGSGYGNLAGLRRAAARRFARPAVVEIDRLHWRLARRPAGHAFPL